MHPAPYVDIAKASIQAFFENTALPKASWTQTYPELSEPKASFVTLAMGGHLRGCIGSIIAHRPLIDDLITNARSAAFNDPRFPPLSKEEYANVSVEVSILTPPVRIEYADRKELKTLIRPFVDGVILRYDGYQATFLPQVWEELSDFDLFFEHLGYKAGLGGDPLTYHPEIYTYQVEKYGGAHDEH